MSEEAGRVARGAQVAGGGQAAGSSVPRHYVAAPARQVQGSLQVPGDKSISHRALMLGAIADGVTRIDGFLASEDCLATLAALRAMGVAIEGPADGRVLVHGVGLTGLRAPAAALDLGNAGTAMRLMMGLLAGQSFDSTLVGDSSLMRRPMERVAQPLRAMGARIDTQAGRPPVSIHGSGALRPIDYTLPMASAQVKSALLLAAQYAQGTTSVLEPVATRDHTERMLRQFGARIERHGCRISLAGGQRLRGGAVHVPGDFSSAAFFIVAGCLAAPQGLTIRNVGCNPTRTGLLQMLELMGADIRVQPQSQPQTSSAQGAAEPADEQLTEPVADIHVRSSPLRGIRVPEPLVALAIDEFPVFFIAAAAAEGQTVVTGAAELRVKESDRLAAMAQGLTTLGVHCELLPDGLCVQGVGAGRGGGGGMGGGGMVGGGMVGGGAGGGGRLGGGRIDSRGDHRIAMAFAIASLLARSPLQIDDVANVATSFPGFVTLARSVGLALQELG
jgi:3-phosphoshikimate 1-carboxyvinyltransferase